MTSWYKSTRDAAGISFNEWLLLLLSSEEVRLSLAKHSPIFFTTSGWSIHSPGLGSCLNRMPRDIYCSQWAESPLGPHKDLVRQPVQVARAQTSLVVDISDHWCVVGAHQHMVILSGLGGNTSVHAARPASLGDWYDVRWRPLHSGQGGHSWPLPNRWGTHLSLASCGDKELPSLILGEN